jgi:quercetin dioxygenase-like cupin family protein
MSKKTLKLTLAGALVACGLGGFAVGLGWASPPRGLTVTGLAGPAVMDEVDSKAEIDGWEAELRVKGQSDVYFTHFKIAPGGYSGWHWHPGPSIIAVKSGTASVYDDCTDPDTPWVFPAGTAFVEDAGCVHLVANQGAVDLEFVVVQIVPKGAPRRIEADPPE